MILLGPIQIQLVSKKQIILKIYNNRFWKVTHKTHWFSVKYSEHSDKSNEPSDTRTNGSDNIELAQTRENITLVRNESEGFGFVIMSSPRFVYHDSVVYVFYF